MPHFRCDNYGRKLVPVAAPREGDPRPSVAELLATAIDEAGISQRELARRLAGSDQSRLEAERRNVSRWMAGVAPTRKSALRLAKILGREAEEFAPPKRDEGAALDDLEKRVAELEAQVADALASRRAPGAERSVRG